MALETNSLSDRESRLAGLLLTVLEAADRGQTPDREEWLARYPEFSSELAEFFASQERVERLATPLRDVTQAARLTCLAPLGTRQSETDSGRPAELPRSF